MMRLLLVIALLSLLLLSSESTAQSSSVTLKATNVVPGMTMLEGDGGFVGGNMTLITGDDGVILIDDGMEPFSQLILDAVSEHSDAPVDFVINTHVHGDHVGSNIALQSSGATVFAHENINKRLRDAEWRTLKGMAPVRAGEMPQVTFSDAVTFHLNGRTGHVVHVPLAHTDGDSFIHFPGINVISAGDVFFNGMFPYIDLDTGGSVDGYLEAQRILLSLANDETKIVPGHGPFANKADLQAAHNMLTDANSRIKALMKAGKSEEEIVTENPLADYHDGWNWGFITTERMTRTLYRTNSSN